MRRELACVAIAACCVLASGCRQIERLTLIRPSADRGSFERVTPLRDVSGKHKGGSGDAMALVASAGNAYRQGDLATAERLSRQALKVDPNSGDAYTLLGAVSEARGDQAGAGRNYQQAVAISGRNGIYANNYGSWLCANGQPADSLGWFERAVADPGYPTPASAYTNAANCAQKASRPVLAESSWRRALELAPTSIAALAGMAKLQFDLGQYFEARAFAERWLAAAPEDAAGLRLASQVEQKLGDNAAAARYLSRLQALPPGAGTAPGKP